MAQAQRADEAGDLDSAARALHPLVRDDPRDVGALLELAWIDYRLARYDDAEANYRLALQGGATGADTHAGLGWSLLRQTRCTEAMTPFRTALALSPSHASAREGLETCSLQDAGSVSAWLMANGYLFANHPWKARAWGVAPGLSFIPADRFQVRAAYRFLRLRAQPEIPVAPLTQHEAYAHVAYATPAFGVELQGGLIFGDTGPAGTSPHVGAVGRWTLKGDVLKGDVLMDLSASFYDDVTVLRAAPSWRIPIADSFHLVPGVAVQRFGDQSAVAGTFTLNFDRSELSVWLGGKYGDEYRPAYLTNFVVYDIAEHNFWGLWAGARVRVTRQLDASVTYSFDRMKDAVTAERSGMHYVSIGPIVSY